MSWFDQIILLLTGLTAIYALLQVVLKNRRCPRGLADAGRLDDELQFFKLVTAK